MAWSLGAGDGGGGLRSRMGEEAVEESGPALLDGDEAGDLVLSRRAAAEAEPQANTGSLVVEVRVVDSGARSTGETAEDFTPLAGAHLELSSHSGGALAYLTAHKSTGTGGRCTWEDLVPGDYFLELAGFHHMVVCVVAGEETTRIWELDPPQEVHGYVRSEQGAPIEGAQIWVSPYANAHETQVVTKTDAMGRYSFPSNIGGRRYLGASAEGYALSALEDLSRGDLGPHETRLRVDFVLGHGGLIVHGFVRDQENQGVEGALVRLKCYVARIGREGVREKHNHPSITVLSQPDGSFTFPGIRISHFDVVATKPGFAQAALTSRLSLDLQGGLVLILEPSVLLTGRIVDPSGAGIDRGGVSCDRKRPLEMIRVGTDSSGHFVLAGLPAGEHSLAASKTNHTADQAQVVLLPNQPQRMRDFVIEPKPGLPVVVRIEPPLGPDGRAWSVVVRGRGVLETRYAKDGCFEVLAPRPGQLDVQVSCYEWPSMSLHRASLTVPAEGDVLLTLPTSASASTLVRGTILHHGGDRERFRLLFRPLGSKKITGAMSTLVGGAFEQLLPAGGHWSLVVNHPRGPLLGTYPLGTFPLDSTLSTPTNPAILDLGVLVVGLPGSLTFETPGGAPPFSSARLRAWLSSIATLIPGPESILELAPGTYSVDFTFPDGQVTTARAEVRPGDETVLLVPSPSKDDARLGVVPSRQHPGSATPPRVGLVLFRIRGALAPHLIFSGTLFEPGSDSFSLSLEAGSYRATIYAGVDVLYDELLALKPGESKNLVVPMRPR